MSDPALRIGSERSSLTPAQIAELVRIGEAEERVRLARELLIAHGHDPFSMTVARAFAIADEFVDECKRRGIPIAGFSGHLTAV